MGKTKLNPLEPQKAQHRGRSRLLLLYSSFIRNKKCDLKILKSLNGFKSTNKIDNYNNRGKKVGEGKKRKEKNPETATEQVKIINVFLESLLSASFPSLDVSVHLASLGCPPTVGWSLDLLWGSSNSDLVLLLSVPSSNVHSHQN